MKARDVWERSEQAWYAKHGLTLPPIGDERRDVASVTLAVKRTGRKPKKSQALLDLLADRRHHSGASLAMRLGVSMGALRAMVTRLRERGFDVVNDPPIRSGLSVQAYQLISPQKGSIT